MFPVAPDPLASLAHHIMGYVSRGSSLKVLTGDSLRQLNLPTSSFISTATDLKTCLTISTDSVTVSLSSLLLALQLNDRGRLLSAYAKSL